MQTACWNFQPLKYGKNYFLKTTVAIFTTRKRSLSQGNVFTLVCSDFPAHITGHMIGGSVSGRSASRGICIQGWSTSRGVCIPGGLHPGGLHLGSLHSGGLGNPPTSQGYYGMWRYASYWNAFLFYDLIYQPGERREYCMKPSNRDSQLDNREYSMFSTAVFSHLV